MPQDIIDQIEPYRSTADAGSGRWAKLSSTIQWRRLVLLLLREIVVELRALVSELRAFNLKTNAPTDQRHPGQEQ
jgi:hypothetical protein